MKIERLAQRGLVYLLLTAGAFLFSWPFVWMLMTSFKTERESYSNPRRLLPRAPQVALQSPYVDAPYFRDLPKSRYEALEPALVEQLRRMSWAVPEAVDREALIQTVAEGAALRLVDMLPPEAAADPVAFEAAALELVDAQLADQLARLAVRRFGLGALRVRSTGLEETEVIGSAEASARWQVTGPGQLVPARDGEATFAEVRYDLRSEGSGGGAEAIVLEAAFTLPFEAAQMHRIELLLHSDDSWNVVRAQVERAGAVLRGAKPRHLGDWGWTSLQLQMPSEEDTTLKRHSWVLLEPVPDAAPDAALSPFEMRVRLELERNSAAGAWWAKLTRNYRWVLETVPFWRYVGTSALLVSLNVIGALASGSLTAYAFARLRWPGRRVGFVVLLATLMIPPQVTMIPQFLIVSWLGWHNTWLPLWVGAFFANAFNVFLLRQFLLGVPRDLEDAARIDGCGVWRVYWHIMLPLVRPALATIAIFTFLAVWNDFMGPLIYLTDQRLFPLSLGLFALSVQSGVGLGMMMAGSFMMTVPVIVLFFFCQRFFIQGITLTGMK